ncbi:MAG: hypothetical protein AAF085_17825 [Planctomycetota bacterium]
MALLLSVPIAGRILRGNPEFLGGPLIAYPVVILVAVATGIGIQFVDPRISAPPKTDPAGQEIPEFTHWVVVALAIALFFVPIINLICAGLALWVTRKHKGTIQRLAWATIPLSTVGMVSVFLLNAWFNRWPRRYLCSSAFIRG